MHIHMHGFTFNVDANTLKRKLTVCIPTSYSWEHSDKKKTSWVSWTTSLFFNKAVSFLLLTSSHWAKAFFIVLFMVCSLFISAQFRLLEQEVVVKIKHSCVILHSIHCQNKSLLICPKQLQYRKETSRDKFWSHKCTQGKKLHYQFRCQVTYLKVYISVLKSAFFIFGGLCLIITECPHRKVNP